MSKNSRVVVTDARTGSLRPFVDSVDIRHSNERASWQDSLVLELNELPPSGMADCYTGYPTLVMHTDNPAHGIERLAGAKRFERLRVTRGAMHFDPAGVLTGARWFDQHRVLILMPTEHSFERALVEMKGTSPVEFHCANNFGDLRLQQIAWALLAECEDNFVSGRLYGESLALALACRLIARFATQAIRPKKFTQGLPQWRLRRAVEYIHEHIDQDMRLQDVAEAAGLSEFYFIRLFRQSMAMTPHNYIVQQRLSLARSLLTDRRITIKVVCRMVGFSNLSHFSAIFKRATGLTPKAYRDAL
jgi:AraC family transcriptional regulator